MRGPTREQEDHRHGANTDGHAAQRKQKLPARTRFPQQILKQTLIRVFRVHLRPLLTYHLYHFGTSRED